MRKATTRADNIVPEYGWQEGRPTHRENCAQGEASVLVLAAIRVMMRHISSLLYDARRIVSLTSELPLLLLVAMSALMVQAMYDVGGIVGAAVAGAGVGGVGVVVVGMRGWRVANAVGGAGSGVVEARVVR